MHNEKFMENLDWVEQLKIRASVGTSGSQSFESYQAIATYKYYTDVSYAGMLGAYVMRLANAADEILPLRDPRVQQNPGYLSIILLARVVTKLGSLPAVDTRIIEGLFTMDLAYLQDLYQRINNMEMPMYKTICPHCGEEVEVPVNFMETSL